MLKHNASNERIKRQYFSYLKEAKRQNEASVDAVAKALARFEGETQYRDFKFFHHQQAIAFKRKLSEQDSKVTGQKLSKATLHSTLSYLKCFFHWLAGQPGYKSRLQYSDADYFNVSEKDARVATARRKRPAPTLEQVRHVILNMPSGTEIERRNRALVAFFLLTAARVKAVASVKLKHINLVDSGFYQDARQVDTKFSKTFMTYFFPVGDDIRQIVVDWVDYLKREKLWGNEDPLFPKTAMTISDAQRFQHVELERKHWAGTSAIRAVFKEAFPAAGLPYFHPHSLRDTLVQLGEKLCRSPEAFKAWSQNLGHEGVLTTFYSYGQVAVDRQGAIIKELGMAGARSGLSRQDLLQAIAQVLNE